LREEVAAPDQALFPSLGARIRIRSGHLATLGATWLSWPDENGLDGPPLGFMSALSKQGVEMTTFVEKLARKEQADEDLYFARREAALLAARGQDGDPSRHVGASLRVISGGQSGVDRAALDVALALDIAVGGWCPRGRGAEDGVIPDRYPLQETPSRDPAQRTEWNVREGDATLVLYRGVCAGGTRLTIELARRLGRPLLARDLSLPVDPLEVAHWLRVNRVRTLNCAGPRESESPGIAGSAQELLEPILAAWRASESTP
jgi:hypothetical protein